MTAEETFKSLGFSKVATDTVCGEDDGKIWLHYHRYDGSYLRDDVYFNLQEKTISQELSTDVGTLNHSITIELLPAIIKQAKELGWYKVPKDEKIDYYTHKSKREIIERKLSLEERKICSLEKIASSFGSFLENKS